MRGASFLNCEGTEDPVDGGSSRGLSEKLFDKRVVLFSSEVSPRSATTLIEQLLALDVEAPEAPVTLYLNSPGGEVNAGFAIYDTIRFIRPPVRIVCTGLCASIASIILLAVPASARLSMPNARYLLHQPLFNGDVIGPASDLEITAGEIMKSRSRINAIIAAACSRSEEQVAADTQRDFWMTAQEAVAYGLVSAIVSNMSEL
ncbi:MAG TPA: ATP-dependent Clp protease proteolytic subunit [Myxococcota bacterium]|nr:ATP-dependent Clp protease proteolytic subunit [Myxococcota bacterium]HPB49871.1 ATP-dependent Clp protease proteolytic subunit [Myxococcota bacterium]HQP94844.1 ATP-dependent Clp protease proteolytic subunit [Myxococcota bacterium]